MDIHVEREHTNLPSSLFSGFLGTPPAPDPEECCGGRSPGTGHTHTDSGSEWDSDPENDPDILSINSIPDQNEVDHQTIPPVLPASTVLAMAQSVGSNLQLSVASALGKIAMKKLRHVVLVANQFRKRHRAKGLGTEHFTEAERLVDPVSTSLGSKWSSGDFPMAHRIGNNLSIIYDSTEICLYSSIKAARHQLKKIPINLNTVHTVRTYPKNFYSNMKTGKGRETSSKDWVSVSEESDMSGPGLKIQNERQKEERQRPKNPTKHLSDLRKRALEEKEELLANKILCAELVEHVENFVIAHEKLTEECLNSLPPSSKTKKKTRSEIGIEWVDYLKIFIDTFLPNSERSINTQVPLDTKLRPTQVPESKAKMSENEVEDTPGFPLPEAEELCKGIMEQDDFDEMGRRNFEAFISNIRENGIKPILGILLDFFQDYLKGRFGEASVHGHERILLVLQAVLSSSNSPVNTSREEEIMDIIVQIIATNPPVRLHPRIVSLIVIIFKSSPDDFWINVTIWICSYISKTLQLFTTSCLHNIHRASKSFNLALSLSNAIELCGISFAYELNWHVHILDFIQGSRVLKDELVRDTATSADQEMEQSDDESEKEESLYSYDLETNTAIEENVLLFLRNFLTNYRARTSVELIAEIHEVALEEYGERLIPYFSSSQHVFQPVLKPRVTNDRGHERGGKKVRDQFRRSRFKSFNKS